MGQIDMGKVVGPGVPTGGSEGQLLVKKSGTNFDAEWKSIGDVDGLCKSKTEATSGTTFTINLPGPGQHLIVVSSTSNTRQALLIVYISTNGNVYASTVYAGNALTITTDTNKVIITIPASASLRIQDFAFYGEPATLSATGGT